MVIDMAEQLRTLKDMTLNCECYFCQGLGGEECYVRIKLSELKDEARKWLKLSDYDLYDLGFGEDDTSKDLRKWIKHFFNLEDNDDTKP